jgi:hypothetical protein
MEEHVTVWIEWEVNSLLHRTLQNLTASGARSLRSGLAPIVSQGP